MKSQKHLSLKARKFINLALDNPHFQCQKKLLMLLKQMLEKNTTVPVYRIKRKISKYLLRRTGNEYPKENILITPGSKKQAWIHLLSMVK